MWYLFPMQVLFAHLPHSELVPSLVNLLKKKHLHKLTTGWQSCAVRALEILTSQSLIDLAPNHIDDVIAVGIPLLFTGRHSNVFAGRMGEVIGQSALAQVHPVFAELAVVLNGKGEPVMTWYCLNLLGCVLLPPSPPPPPPTHTHTHTKMQIVLLPYNGHAHLAKPGCLCTKQAL